MFLNCFSHELLLALSQASLNAKVPVGHPEIWRKASSLVAQTVKSPPAVQETQVRSLGREDPLKKAMADPPQYSCLENSTDRGAWQATVHGGHKESDTTEQLTQWNITPP